MVEEQTLKLFETVKEQFVKYGYTICGNKQAKDSIMFCAKEGKIGDHIMINIQLNNDLRFSMRSVMGFVSIAFNSVKFEKDTIGFYDKGVRIGVFYLNKVRK